MLDKTQTNAPMNSMDVPEPTNDLFGKLEAKEYICGLTKGLPEFNPEIHQTPYTAIFMYLQPLPEMDIKYPKWLECSWVAQFSTWQKITRPSIKANYPKPISTANELNTLWVRFTRVDSLEKPFPKKDDQGNPTGEMGVKKTWKFVTFYTSEDECRAAYIAAGGKANDNGHNVPAAVANEDTEKATAFQFLKVIVSNAVRDQTDWQQAKEKVAQALTGYPTVANFFTADSEETAKLMNEANDKLLPF